MRGHSLTRRRLLAVLATSPCVMPLSAPAQPMAQTTERAKLEAAIVVNMLQFVQWPDEEKLPANTRLKLCIDMASPVYAAARQLDEQPLRKMRLSVQPLDSTPASCRVLFVDTPASQRAASVISSSDAVFVVAGSQADAAGVSTVSLLDAQGRLAFDISQRRARQSGLDVSSRLLRLARKVLE